MRLGLYCLRRIAWRALAVLIAIEGLWVLLTVLEITRRRPILGSWAFFDIAPILWAHGSVPCALAALASGVAGAFAGLGHDGELTTAAAAGIGPKTWLAPVALVGVLVTPWTLFSVARVLPATALADDIARRSLLRSPEMCLRILVADPSLLPPYWLRLQPGEHGRFQDLWLVEVDPSNLPKSVLRARAGSVSAPLTRDTLRLEFEDVRLWSRDSHGGLRTATAAAMTMERPVPEISVSRSTSIATPVRNQTFAQLRSAIARLPDGPERDLYRAELAGRLGLALVPLPLLLASVALGMRVARLGAWSGSLAGVLLVGMFLFPAQVSCARWISSGAPSWIAALPATLLAVASAKTLLNWRTR